MGTLDFEFVGAVWCHDGHGGLWKRYRVL